MSADVHVKGSGRGQIRLQPGVAGCEVEYYDEITEKVYFRYQILTGTRVSGSTETYLPLVL